MQEITRKLGISAADAQARLQDLATVPIDQLLLLQKSGPKVVAAQAKLVALGKVPAADLAVLKDASKAAAASPEAVAQLLLDRGRRRGRVHPADLPAGRVLEPEDGRAEHEREHEAMVEAELAKLSVDPGLGPLAPLPRSGCGFRQRRGDGGSCCLGSVRCRPVGLRPRGSACCRKAIRQSNLLCFRSPLSIRIERR